jgi:FYVE/RhoGEF/PH domain-containing protein 1
VPVLETENLFVSLKEWLWILFQFSDLLLLCSSRLLPAAYRLRAKFWVEGIQVLEGDNLETANTFYIRDDHKNVELYTQ